MPASPEILPLPPLLRTELLHPMLAHIPLGLLGFAGILGFAQLALSRHKFYPYVRGAYLLNLVPGVISAWVTLQLGEMAESIVNRVICDPTVTHEHARFGEWSTWIFTALVVFELAVRKRKVPQSGRAAQALVGGIATAFLIWAGHLGASLVYQQGAGVYHPTPECREFE